jgi:hypothetical protein
MVDPLFDELKLKLAVVEPLANEFTVSCARTR